ncbi:MAG: type II toxin-antitoxin system VapC family toxin [Patescibacteria group bacterium]
MLLDSTTFVDFLRGYKPATAAFEKSLYGQSASVMTKLELVIGTIKKREISNIEKVFDKFEIKIIPISEDISKISEKILIKYHHSNGIGIRDSFIAATALVYDEELVTRNTKHFDFIPNLKLFTPY